MTDEGRILSTIILPIYQSFKPEHGSIVSKKLSTLGTESIHLATHSVISPAIMSHVSWFLCLCILWWDPCHDDGKLAPGTDTWHHPAVWQHNALTQENSAKCFWFTGLIVLVATTAGVGGRQEKLLNLTTQRGTMLCKLFNIYYGDTKILTNSVVIYMSSSIGRCFTFGLVEFEFKIWVGKI